MNRDDVERIWDQIEPGPHADEAERHETIGLEIPVGEHGRATLLTLAAEHRIMAGELDRARDDLELAGAAHPATRSRRGVPTA